MRSLSNLAIRAQQAENSDEVWLVKLEINHSDIIGKEEIANGDGTATAGWTGSGATASVSSGKLRCTNSGAASGYLYQLTDLVPGRNYRFRATLMAASSGSTDVGTVMVGTSAGTGGVYSNALVDVGQTVSQEFVATADATYISLVNNSAVNAAWLEWDNISVVEREPIRVVNDMQNLVVAPENNIAGDPSTWTPTGTGTVETFGSGWRVSDTSAANQFLITKYPTGCSPNTGTITEFFQIARDSIGKATRFPCFYFGDGSGSTLVFLDTSTGEYKVETSGGGTPVKAGVFSLGSSWFVYITRSVPDTSINIYPAYGAGNLGSAQASNAATGAVMVERVGIYNGTWGDLKHYVAFPFQLDLPGEDMEQPATARLKIDNIDQSIVSAIRALTSAPTASMEVVLASQPEQVEVGFYDLTIRTADFDALYVEAALTFEQIYTEPVTLEMTPARFPGLF